MKLSNTKMGASVKIKMGARKKQNQEITNIKLI